MHHEPLDFWEGSWQSDLENGGVWVVIDGFVDQSAILGAGVYALVQRGAVVYIGQARRMLARIEAHRSLGNRRNVPSWMPIKGIQFDSVWTLPCPVDMLDVVERRMIERYRPRYNVKLKPPGLPEVLHVNGQMVALVPTQPKFERRI